MLKRVVVTGPESTGKTTLAARLCAHYGAVVVPEFVRGYLDAMDPPRNPRSLVLVEDVPAIARGQMQAEDEAAQRASSLLICDTDLHSTKVYAEHYFGSCPEWIARAAAARRYDLHLLLDVDVAWQEDPLRDRPHGRREMWTLFRDELRRSGRRVLEIGGDWEERFARSVAAIDALLAGR